MVECGPLVDGVLSKPTVTVDGLTWERFASPTAPCTGGSPTAKLSQAVVRLGMFRCKNLIISMGMRSLFQKRMAVGTQEQCAVLWHHGYVTGFLSGQINRAFRLGFDGDEFSAGLLHDLGRILLADAGCAARADIMDFREGPDALERERQAIGVDHCALGGWFAEHSKLPDPLIRRCGSTTNRAPALRRRSW